MAHPCFQTVNAWSTAHTWHVDAGSRSKQDFDPVRKMAALLKYKPLLQQLRVVFERGATCTNDALRDLFLLATKLPAGLYVSVLHNEAVLRQMVQQLKLAEGEVEWPRIVFLHVQTQQDWDAAAELVEFCSASGRCKPVQHLNMYATDVPRGGQEALVRICTAIRIDDACTSRQQANSKQAVHALTLPMDAMMKAGLQLRKSMWKGLQQVPQLYATHDAAQLPWCEPHVLPGVTVLHEFSNLSGNAVTGELISILSTCARLQQVVLHNMEPCSLLLNGHTHRLAAELPAGCSIAITPSCCYNAGVVAFVRAMALKVETPRKVQLVLWRASNAVQELCACLLAYHFAGLGTDMFEVDGYTHETTPPPFSLFVNGHCLPSYDRLMQQLEAAAPNVHAVWAELARPPVTESKWLSTGVSRTFLSAQ